MVVYLPIHVVAGHDVVLYGIHTAFLDDYSAILHTHRAQDALHIKLPIFCAGEICISDQIIKAVCIQLRTDQLRQDRVGAFMADHIRNILGKTWTCILQDLRDLCILFNDAAGIDFMRCIGNSLKGMGVWTMADVMQHAC